MKKQTLSLQQLVSSHELLNSDDQANVKGGRRYVTKSRSAFEAKRNQLQNQQACMCITHVGNTYCIEW